MTAPGNAADLAGRIAEADAEIVRLAAMVGAARVGRAFMEKTGTEEAETWLAAYRQLQAALKARAALDQPPKPLDRNEVIRMVANIYSGLVHTCVGPGADYTWLSSKECYAARDRIIAALTGTDAAP